MAIERQIFFTALAFMAVISKEGKNIGKGESIRIEELAAQIEQFCCTRYNRFIVEFADDKLSNALDSVITSMVEEYQGDKNMVLPASRDMTIKTIDRLYLRHSRRVRAETYATAPIEELHATLRQYLDEEIQAGG